MFSSYAIAMSCKEGVISVKKQQHGLVAVAEVVNCC